MDELRKMSHAWTKNKEGTYRLDSNAFDFYLKQEK